MRELIADGLLALLLLTTAFLLYVITLSCTKVGPLPAERPEKLFVASADSADWFCGVYKKHDKPYAVCIPNE